METPVKILVVDDEMPICELMKINLELAGFNVDIANSAEEALQKHLADYALMVFDIMMGEISGLELVSKVRAMPSANRRVYTRSRRLHQKAVLDARVCGTRQEPVATSKAGAAHHCNLQDTVSRQHL